MSAKGRIAVIWLLSIGLVAAFTPIPWAEARGGGGHGGGGHGSGGHGGGGGHVGGAHFVGGGHGGGHFAGAGRVGGVHFGGGRVGGVHFGGGHVGSGHVGGFGGAHAFASRSGTWNHAGSWNHALAGNRGYGGYGGYRRYGGYGGYGDYGGYGGYGAYGWPWYALDWGTGIGWPNYYNYGYAPDGDLYGSYYGSTAVPYTYDPYDSGAVPYADDAYGSQAVPSASVTPAGTVTETGPPTVGSEASDFYTQALTAFRRGDYGNATRLAGHAAIDDPRNPNVHILAMLGLFATGEYRAAAIEAHAVADTGHIPDWPTLYGFYENMIPYTEQLRKLEKFVGEHPSAGEGRFLLGFQYLMEGYKDAAETQLREAAVLTPHDTIATKLLTQAGGTITAY